MNAFKRNEKIISDIIINNNIIENEINNIIAGYLKAEKDDIMRNIVLNSLIINLSSKLKILLYIIKSNKVLENKDIQEFKNSMFIVMGKRNIIAHSDKVSFPHFTITDLGKEIENNEVTHNIKLQLSDNKILNVNNGVIEELEIKKIYDDFMKHYEIAKKYIIEINKKLKIRNYNDDGNSTSNFIFW